MSSYYIELFLRVGFFSCAVNFNEAEQSIKSVDDSFPSLSELRLEDEVKDPLEDIEPNAIGFLPGDEEELLAGLIDDFDLSGLPTQLEELDDDFFGSGGGIEIESDPQENLTNGISRLSVSDGINGNIIANYGFPNGFANVSGEHPYGEHPSRTLFVRNINSNVEESELKSLFEVKFVSWIPKFYFHPLLFCLLNQSLDAIFSSFLWLPTNSI